MAQINYCSRIKLLWIFSGVNNYSTGQNVSKCQASCYYHLCVSTDILVSVRHLSRVFAASKLSDRDNISNCHWVLLFHTTLFLLISRNKQPLSELSCAVVPSRLQLAGFKLKFNHQFQCAPYVFWKKHWANAEKKGSRTSHIHKYREQLMTILLLLVKLKWANFNVANWKIVRVCASFRDMSLITKWSFRIIFFFHHSSHSFANPLSVISLVLYTISYALLLVFMLSRCLNKNNNE